MKIRTLNFSYFNKNPCNEFIEDLANNLPTSIKEVSIFYHNYLTFKSFLENCHNCLEIINLNCIELKVLQIILNS